MEVNKILREQVELLREMYLVLEREHEVLKNGKPQDIVLIAEEKQELQQQLEACEIKRVQTMGHITLAEYEQECQEDITDLANQYRTLLPKIAELIELNQVLTEMGYNHYNGMLELISSSAEKKVKTYGQRGYMNKQEVKTSALLNRQA